MVDSLSNCSVLAHVALGLSLETPALDESMSHLDNASLPTDGFLCPLLGLNSCWGDLGCQCLILFHFAKVDCCYPAFAE